MAGWIKDLIRIIPDYPKPGIRFQDITTLLGDARGFQRVVDEMTRSFEAAGITHVAGIEARGFILGGAVAHQLGAGFVPVRKAGKLPAATLSEAYSLEYGEDALEIHADALKAGDRVLIVDDVLATGGTAGAVVNLVRRSGASVVGAAFLIDLRFLGGHDSLQDMEVRIQALSVDDGDLGEAGGIGNQDQA